MALALAAGVVAHDVELGSDAPAEHSLQHGLNAPLAVVLVLDEGAVDLDQLAADRLIAGQQVQRAAGVHGTRQPAPPPLRVHAVEAVVDGGGDDGEGPLQAAPEASRHDGADVELGQQPQLGALGSQAQAEVGAGLGQGWVAQGLASCHPVEMHHLGRLVLRLVVAQDGGQLTVEVAKVAVFELGLAGSCEMTHHTASVATCLTAEVGHKPILSSPHISALNKPSKCLLHKVDAWVNLALQHLLSSVKLHLADSLPALPHQIDNVAPFVRQTHP